MADEKRVSILLPVDVHAAAKAVADYSFGFFQLWPGSDDVWRGVRANSVGRALAWFVKFGMDHARTCIDRELNEQQKILNQQRQIVEFFVDRPGKDSARKSDCPEGSHAANFFDDLRESYADDEEISTADLVTREEAVCGFEVTRKRVVQITLAANAVCAVLYNETAYRASVIEAGARRLAPAKVTAPHPCGWRRMSSPKSLRGVGIETRSCSN